MTTPTTVNVRLQIRADTAANWTAVNPILLVNEVGLETDTKKLKVGDGTTAWASLAYFPSIVSGGTVLGNLEIGSTGTLTFEGSTVDGYETQLAVTDPTADRTITLPDQSGTVVVSGNASIIDGDIADDAEIAVSKLANGTVNQVLVTDGTDVSWSDDLTIAGNLTVNGTTTTVNTETLVVEDKNIELGVIDTPTDTTADGGGITLKGSTDKTINWVDATDAWTSSEPLDLPAGTDAAPSLFFGGDVDTGLYSPGADQVAISTSGTERVEFGTSEVVFNDGGANYDFRIEGDTNSSLFFVDASADAVGVGTTSPQALLETSSASSGTPALSLLLRNSAEAVSSSTNLYFATGSGAVSATNLTSIIRSEITQSTPSALKGDLLFYTNSGDLIAERARIDSSGRLLVGTSSAFESFSNLQVADVTGLGINLSHFTNTASAGSLSLYKSRGSTVGTNALVSANDRLGGISFRGADGTNYIVGATIAAFVDGTPGANDMPGRLVFSSNPGAPATGPSEAMRINSAQELLIGYTSDNGAYKLQVNSQIFATSATIATSDGRYKENVATLDGCLDLVKALRPVSFDWKHQEPITRVDEEGETVVVREAHNFPDGTQVGFIAQEVETVLADKPWLGSVIKQNVRPAVTDNDGNELAPEEEFLGIAEGNLVAVLTSALKDAIGEIESLKARVAALEAS